MGTPIFLSFALTDSQLSLDIYIPIKVIDNMPRKFDFLHHYNTYKKLYHLT